MLNKIERMTLDDAVDDFMKNQYHLIKPKDNWLRRFASDYHNNDKKINIGIARKFMLVERFKLEIDIY